MHLQEHDRHTLRDAVLAAEGDPVLLEQAITNIMANAIEACGGRAVIKTGAEGVYVGAIPAKGLGIALKIVATIVKAPAGAVAMIRAALENRVGIDCKQVSTGTYCAKE